MVCLKYIGQITYSFVVQVLSSIIIFPGLAYLQTARQIDTPTQGWVALAIIR